jgi:7-cyano-7-deazaguanine reductase
MKKNITHLGKNSDYSSFYDVNLLQPLSRESNHTNFGKDIWNAYEFSWLNSKGKPEQRHLQLRINSNSSNIIESKSLKLYLNGFNNEPYNSENDVISIIKTDLEKSLSSEVNISFLKKVPIKVFEGTCLDSLDIYIDSYSIDAKLLSIDNEKYVTTSKSVFTHLFRSNCPVTGQPDWATIWVSYTGPKINNDSLLKYLVSYRNHDGFHETCIDSIFTDILMQCKCDTLTVYGGFTRRGGIDINPYRTTDKSLKMPFMRTVRQ